VPHVSVSLRKSKGRKEPETEDSTGDRRPGVRYDEGEGWNTWGKQRYDGLYQLTSSRKRDKGAER